MSRRLVESSLSTLVTTKEAAQIRLRQLIEEHQGICEQIRWIESLTSESSSKKQLSRLRCLEREAKVRTDRASEEIELIELYIQHRIREN